jgi:hypothetical protein
MIPLSAALLFIILFALALAGIYLFRRNRPPRQSDSDHLD